MARKSVQLDRLSLSLSKVDIEVDIRGLSGRERMFWHSKGQTRVDVTAVIIINALFNNDTRRHPKMSITFTVQQ
ncbi:hypothetical protein J1N35_010474 [Gossypium stocksii]|uniref:Uncharacterized protein n=1 Tax=Gossypium stocksii TaxID=47602 RepID=A0A9D3W0E1_9ROSI|nr:hypothetical protein J1N35_010474 [Gossypium stocksii]